MSQIRKIAITLTLGALFCAGAPGKGAQAAVVAVPGGSLLNNLHVQSMVDLKFKKVVRQGYDVSCGAAAVATLLKYYWGQKAVTEKHVIEAMIELGNKEAIQKYGFSLLEIKRFAEEEGYVSRGYRLKGIGILQRLKVPAITLVNVRGYAHFVVVKGTADGYVFVADPAFGNRTVPVREFDKEWNSVVLVVLSKTKKANNEFTLEQSAHLKSKDMVPLLNQTLHTVIPPSFGEF